MKINVEEKIIKILAEELCCCHCDNCEFESQSRDSRECYNCCTNHQRNNWKLSENTAKKITREITKEWTATIAEQIIKNIINE